MKDSAAPPRPQSLNNYGCKSSATSCRCLRVGVVFRLDVTNDLICDASSNSMLSQSRARRSHAGRNKIPPLFLSFSGYDIRS